MNSAETIGRVPIHTDADGVVRVAGTRVTLDTMVAAFDAGATVEEIAQQYSSISLADVYSVITYSESGSHPHDFAVRHVLSLLSLSASHATMRTAMPSDIPSRFLTEEEAARYCRYDARGCADPVRAFR